MNIVANFRNPDNDPYLMFIKETYKDKPGTFWYDKYPNSIDELQSSPYNFLFLHEPNEFFGYATSAKSLYSWYTAILTWDDGVLKECNNAIRFTYNGVTLDNNFISEMNSKNKVFDVTFLCGVKKLVSGHFLRHRVYNIENNITVPHNWYYVLEDFDHKNGVRPGYGNYSKDTSHIPHGVDIVGYGRRTLFKDSMFNVVIENVNSLNWYNKIGDNFVSKTVPIYWGCENISEFGYDERGIIRFKDENELVSILNSLTPQKYYEMKPYVDYNYEIAKQDFFETRIREFFDEFYRMNDI